MIHQSTFREDTGLRVRVVSRNRTGVASSNDFTERGAREAAASAKEMAEVAAPDPLFPGLAPKADVADGRIASSRPPPTSSPGGPRRGGRAG